jgi:chromosome partitioning protein
LYEFIFSYIMPIIAFLSQKGGAGKTTLATCIARELVIQGHDAILIDSDPQGSARDWRAAAEIDTVPVLGMDRPTLDKDLKAINPDGKKWLIIDGAPRSEVMTASAIRAADMVVIPVQPSPYDIWAASDLVELVKSRQQITDGKPKAAFLISRAIKRTRLTGEVSEALAEFDISVFQSFTTQRQTYPQAAAQGLTPGDIEPEGEAAKEIRAVLLEIIASMNS